MTRGDSRNEAGIAFVVVLMCVAVVITLGAALALTSSSETRIAASYRDSREGLYATEAGIERAIADLPSAADWDRILDGSVTSSFVRGAASGPRVMANGAPIDPTQVANVANCQKIEPCSSTEMDLVSAERPWGVNNPRWRPFAYGNLVDMVSTRTIDSLYYLVVLAGDDPSENDGDPMRDGAVPCGGRRPEIVLPVGVPPAYSCNPGSGIIELRAEAFGPGGSRQTIEVTVAAAPAGVRMLSWRDPHVSSSSSR